MEFPIVETHCVPMYTFTLTQTSEHWIDVRVVEVLGEDIHGREYCIGDDISGGITAEIEKAHTFITGFVSWDGCAQFGFPDTPLQVHWDGEDGAKAFGDLFPAIYDKACDMFDNIDNESDMRRTK